MKTLALTLKLSGELQGLAALPLVKDSPGTKWIGGQLR